MHISSEFIFAIKRLKEDLVDVNNFKAHVGKTIINTHNKSDFYITAV